MARRLISALLLLGLLAPEAIMAQTANRPSRPAAAASTQPAAPPQNQNASSSSQETARPQPAARSRSYEREVHGRRHSGMSKHEKVFLVAVAGTSMGIGALAGGGTGLAIGAIVGGWGAYAGHRLWRWIR